MVQFAIEYFLRLWSVGCRSKYARWRGRLKFIIRPFSIIDLAVVVSSIFFVADHVILASNDVK